MSYFHHMVYMNIHLLHQQSPQKQLLMGLSTLLAV
jgi:hypothetical protein